MEPKTESNENLKQKPMSPEETATVGVVRESDSLKWEGFVIRVDTRHGTGSHFVTQRPSDPGIQRPGDPVDPVTLFYNELQMSTYV